MTNDRFGPILKLFKLSKSDATGRASETHTKANGVTKMSDTNTATATEAAKTQTAPGANGKAKTSVAATLAEMKEEGKTSPKPKKEGKAKTKGKAKAAGKTAETPAETGPNPNAPTLDPLKPVTWLKAKSAVGELTEDRRLQHRKDMTDDKEGGAVDTYAEAYKEGKELPPVRYVLDTSDTKDKGTKWLVDGYQRKAALKKAKVKETNCEYVEGNFADALLLSLSANAENSVLPRTKDDARRSVFALLDNKDLLAAVLASCKAEYGSGERKGVHRVFADVCGCSTGTVANALAARGKKASGDKIVEAPVKKDDKPTNKKDKETSENPKNNAGDKPDISTPASPEEVKAADRAKFTELMKRPPEDLFSDMRKRVRGLAAIMGGLVLDEKTGAATAEALNASGFPFDNEYFDRARRDGANFAPYYEALEFWSFIEAATRMIDTAESAAKEASGAAIPGTV